MPQGQGTEHVRAVLTDIDGTLTISWRPLPGTVRALHRIRDAGLATVLVTNTTSRTRDELADLLNQGGFEVDPATILTAPVATAAYLTEHHPGARCLVLNSGDGGKDLAGLRLVDSDPDVVVLGSAGPEFDYHAVNQAFRYVHEGAPLVAMHRGRYWRTDGGLELDGGAYVHALEHAAGVRATVVGKPAPEFFAAALRTVPVPAEAAMMVGDDIESDVLGAQECGITGVLVRTGKYDDADTTAARGQPDHVLDSFANLPSLLGID